MPLPPDLASIPTSPGVYQYLDPAGTPLYVGKAKNLRARLSQYFTGDQHPRTARMLSVADQVTWVVCSSENEALVLEREWIAALQPPFNVKLREGNGYAGVALTRDDAPRLFPWRGQRPKNAAVFGPYPQTSAKTLMDALTAGFGVRSCNDRVYRRAETTGRACLLGETGRCLAPCIGTVSLDAHAAAAAELAKFLSGGASGTIDRLTEQMRAFAAEENFEAAARRRDQIAALGRLGEVQHVLGPDTWDASAIAVVRDGDSVGVAVTTVTGGVVRRVLVYDAENDPQLDDIATLTAVAEQLARKGDLPAGALADAVTPAGTRTPRKRREKDLVEFTRRQAAHAARSAEASPWAATAGRDEALIELGDVLETAGLPRRIECVDISHTAGKNSIGAVVVSVDGVPVPGQYRHKKLPHTDGDDYEAIYVTVLHRLSGRRMGLPELPDILLIDGGPGQVAAAAAAAAETLSGDERANLRIVGIAKRMEELWPEAADDPVILSRNSPALRLVQLVRDEAHKTAISRHRRQRDKAAVTTLLDGAPGIGPARRSALLARFTTLDGVAAATEAELAEVLGPTVGARLWRLLHGSD